MSALFGLLKQNWGHAARMQKRAKPLAELPLPALQRFAWEMADVVETGKDRHAVRYARILERQAREEISRRMRRASHA